MTFTEEQKREILEAIKAFFVDKRRDQMLRGTVERIIGAPVKWRAFMDAVSYLTVGGIQGEFGHHGDTFFKPWPLDPASIDQFFRDIECYPIGYVTPIPAYRPQPYDGIVR